MRKTLIAIAVAAGLSSLTPAANAQVTTDNLQVQIVISAGCTLQNVAGMLDFGTHSLLSSNVDSTATLEVLCTTGVPYSVSLNGGSAGNVNARRMQNGADQVNYQLYSDPSRTQVWGETESVNRVTGTGTGVAQVLTIYGRVPAQTTPPAGTYTDDVTITLYF